MPRIRIRDVDLKACWTICLLWRGMLSHMLAVKSYIYAKMSYPDISWAISMLRRAILIWAELSWTSFISIRAKVWWTGTIGRIGRPAVWFGTVSYHIEPMKAIRIGRKKERNRERKKEKKGGEGVGGVGGWPSTGRHGCRRAQSTRVAPQAWNRGAAPVSRVFLKNIVLSEAGKLCFASFFKKHSFKWSRQIVCRLHDFYFFFKKNLLSLQLGCRLYEFKTKKKKNRNRRPSVSKKKKGAEPLHGSAHSTALRPSARRPSEALRRRHCPSSRSLLPPSALSLFLTLLKVLSSDSGLEALRRPQPATVGLQRLPPPSLSFSLSLFSFRTAGVPNLPAESCRIPVDLVRYGVYRPVRHGMAVFVGNILDHGYQGFRSYWHDLITTLKPLSRPMEFILILKIIICSI